MVSAFTGNQAALAGGWHHLAVTYDGRGGAAATAGVTFYVDGVVVPTTRTNNASYVAMENRTAPLQIGRAGPACQQYNGAIDEIRIWNVVRSQGQIQSQMFFELGDSEPGLVAYWKFNAGVGTTAADGSLLVNTATMFNGTTWMSGGPMDPPAPDVTPPEISNVVVSNITASTAVVTFNTNEVTSGWVSFTEIHPVPAPMYIARRRAPVTRSI